jgi:hypothetical protein
MDRLKLFPRACGGRTSGVREPAPREPAPPDRPRPCHVPMDRPCLRSARTPRQGGRRRCRRVHAPASLPSPQEGYGPSRGRRMRSARRRPESRGERRSRAAARSGSCNEELRPVAAILAGCDLGFRQAVNLAHGASARAYSRSYLPGTHQRTSGSRPKARGRGPAAAAEYFRFAARTQ